MGAPSSEQITLNEQLAIFQKQLDEKHLIIDTILKSTQAGYWDWNIKEKTEYLSPALKKMFGYEDDEINNHPDSWKKLVHPDDLPGIFECYSLHVQSEGIVPYSYSARFYHKNGSTVNIYCEGQIIDRDEAGKPVRMIGVYKDITELTQKKIKLAQRNAELEDFVYATSHDLKEPLLNINSFSKLLSKEIENTDNEKLKGYANIINTGSDRMYQLVESILEFSKLADGKVLKFDRVDLNQILEQVRQSLEVKILEENVSLHVKDLPNTYGSASLLSSVFKNLIENAIKFNTCGHPKIEIDYKEENNKYLFSIKDNGIGVKGDFKESIFEMFNRLNIRNEFQGSGMGLSICKKIIELHKGEIWVENNKSEGSTFYFTIPKE